MPTGPSGDANGDGTRDAFDDEFVEIVNRGEDTLDLSGVKLVESGDTVLTLQTACMEPSQGLVVFGGVSDGASPDLAEGVEVRVSSTRFGFANSGGSFQVRGNDGTELASVQWESAPPVSYTLSPQLDGDTYVLHGELANDSPTSPGRCAGGDPLSSGCPATRRKTDAGAATDSGSDTRPSP